MSIQLDTDLGYLNLRLGRWQLEYRRHVRLNHGRWMPRWVLRRLR